MPSQRTKIRTELKALIQTLLGSSYFVYNNRVHDLTKSKLPMVNVLTPSEKIERRSELLTHRYTADLVVQIIDRHSDAETLATNLDTLANSIQAIVLAYQNNPTNVNKFDVLPDSVEFSYQDELDKIYGSCIAKFLVVYEDDDAMTPDRLELLDPFNTRDPETGDVIGFDLTKLNPLGIYHVDIQSGEDNPDVSLEIVYDIPN